LRGPATGLKHDAGRLTCQFRGAAQAWLGHFAGPGATEKQKARSTDRAYVFLRIDPRTGLVTACFAGVEIFGSCPHATLQTPAVHGGGGAGGTFDPIGSAVMTESFSRFSSVGLTYFFTDGAPRSDRGK
jgi:hypothetical protein